MGENERISKKDLLEKYGISYGTLYRWKRSGLIPDEWFMKTSSVTGQQTFFPKKLICERIERILDVKDNLGLEELARSFAGEEKNEEYLIVDTDFGIQKFRLAEVKSVSVSKGTETKLIFTNIYSRIQKGIMKK